MKRTQLDQLKPLRLRKNKFLSALLHDLKGYLHIEMIDVELRRLEEFFQMNQVRTSCHNEVHGGGKNDYFQKWNNASDSTYKVQ